MSLLTYSRSTDLCLGQVSRIENCLQFSTSYSYFMESVEFERDFIVICDPSLCMYLGQK